MIALYRVINNMHLCIGLVCRFLQYTMASLRNVISHMFNKYSLATNTLTSGLLMGLGDLIVQNISVLGASDQINLQYTSQCYGVFCHSCLFVHGNNRLSLLLLLYQIIRTKGVARMFSRGDQRGDFWISRGSKPRFSGICMVKIRKLEPWGQLTPKNHPCRCH